MRAVAVAVDIAEAADVMAQTKEERGDRKQEADEETDQEQGGQPVAWPLHGHSPPHGQARDTVARPSRIGARLLALYTR